MMEGKRFGVGLVAGILLALALVAVSGGLGSTPLTASFGPAAAVPSSSTTTVATSTATSTTMAITTMTTTAPPQSVSYTLSTTSTTSGGSGQSLTSNVTNQLGTATSSTTVTSTVSTAFSVTTTNSSPASQSAGTAATNANDEPYNFFSNSGTNEPARLDSIAQQPIVSKAEVLAPVLAAFLLGAFLYRVVIQERERPKGD